MRRSYFLALLVVCSAAVLGGCSRTAPVVVVAPTDNQQPAPPGSPAAPADSASGAGVNLDLGIPSGKQEQYDGLLRAALNSLAERKYSDALVVLQTAQGIQDTEEVRREIDRTKSLLLRKQAADKTVQEIGTVLKEGNPDEAARLATAGLQQFGGGEDGQRLVSLKQQADAVAAVVLDDKAARLARFGREGEQALQENNLRAAAIAFEGAIDAGGGDDVRRKLDDVRGRLARYDEQRTRAADLRRDVYQIEDALAALQEAQKAWDTLQVRQDLDDYNLALQKRRDRISVADFDVRGEMGVGLIGRTVAEELLPAFKARFDVVEREQLAKLTDELKLEANDLAANNDGRRELGRLAKIRYLVLGSVSALGGVTVHARLVDVQTGLIVQTGKIVAATPDDAIGLLPQLAQMLTMNDQDRQALEQQLALKAAPQAVKPIEPAAAIAAAPAAPADNLQPPPPLVAFNPRPPDFGGLQAADFNQLPLMPPPNQMIVPQAIVFPQADPLRVRFLTLALMFGDNLFRRGRFRDALLYYEMAFNLAPDEIEVRIRLDRLRLLLPPLMSPVVGVPTVPVFYPPIIRPRIAVIGFMVNADPRFLPIGYGEWAADYLTSQLYPYYDVVDRGLVYWWMARLGLSARDVLVNPAARWWLARALNVRFFVFGAVIPTASFNVNAHMVNAETGARSGVANIHVQDHNDIKLRMPEIVSQLRGDPHQSDQMQKDSQERERELNEVRKLLREGKAGLALDLGRKSLERRPNDVAMRTLVAQAEQLVKQQTIADTRLKETEKHQAELLAAKKHQDDLAKQAEIAKLKALEEAKNRDDAGRKVRDAQLVKANENLVTKANTAIDKKDLVLAGGLLAAAVALKPSNTTQQQLVDLQAKEKEAAKAKAEEQKKKLEADKLKKQEFELAKLRTQLDGERKAKEAEDLKRKKAQEEHDTAAYMKLMENAQSQLRQEKYDAALTMLHAARDLRTTAEVNKLIEEALDKKGKAEAEKKGAEAKAALEKRLAEEKAARDKTNLEAAKKQEQYTQALTLGQKALADKRYDEAANKFKEASALFKTDAALNGIKQAEDLKKRALVVADAEKRKQDEEAQRLAKVKQLLSEGQTALAAKQYDKAIKSLADAKQLAPTNADVLAALNKAELAAAEARKPDTTVKPDTGAEKKKAEFAAQVTKARQALTAKRFDEALLALGEADKLIPNDKDVAALRKQAEAGKSDALADAKKLEDQKRMAAEYNRLMTLGQKAMTGKRYTEAAKAFADALKVQPNDAAAGRGMADAQKAIDDAKNPPKPDPKAEYSKQMQNGANAEKQQRWDDAMKAYQEALRLVPNDAKANQGLKNAEYQQHMGEGQKAQKAKRFNDAVREFEAALKAKPNDPTATDALKRAKTGKQ